MYYPVQESANMLTSDIKQIEVNYILCYGTKKHELGSHPGCAALDTWLDQEQYWVKL